MKERVGLTTLVCQKRERKSLCKARDTGIVMCFRPLSDLENDPCYCAHRGFFLIKEKVKAMASRILFPSFVGR